MSFEKARARVRVPVGRHPMANIRASQPLLVWGPWCPIPPKAVMMRRTEMTPVPVPLPMAPLTVPVPEPPRVNACTPEEAFRCLMSAEIEVLVVGNCFPRKGRQNPTLKLDYSKVFDLD